jgi:hypothetical protein
MNRYDKDRDGRLKYSEFCDSFLPLDPFHAKLLAKKAPLNVREAPRRDLLYYPETRELLIACWRMHFEHEIEAERLRVLFQKNNPNFDGYSCFSLIDGKGDGMIDTQEVKDLMIRHGMYVSEKESCGLIDRYDRDKDGTISYAEFIEELKPKLLSN